MNTRELIRNAKVSLTVVTGVAVIFSSAFVVTTLVATAAEEEQTGEAALADEHLAATVGEAAPRTEAPRREPAPFRRPAFADIDTDGDGSISEEEFKTFRPAGPSARIFDAPRSRDDWANRRPRREARAARPERFDDREFGRGPRDDRYRARDDNFGPPPGRRGGASSDHFGPPERFQGPPPFQRGGRGGGQDHRQFDRQCGEECDRQLGRGGRDFGPPPRHPDDDFAPDSFRRPPRRPDY